MTAHPTCSLIIVNFNDVHHLRDCLTSLQGLIYPSECLDVIMIENGSDTASIEFVRQTFPAVRPVVNTVNNFAKALNLGVSMATGDYIGFLNNDVTLEPRWLQELTALLDVEKAAGAAGGKILFKDGRINSVGHRHLANFYFEDLGFNEEDRGQYEATREVIGLCWAAVLFRRACLEDVGPIDEDFVMYLEDVDYAERCRVRGWKLLYMPTAVVYHEFHGSSASPNIPYYFYNRNRFLYVAKHAAEALPHAVTTSHFFNNRQYDQLLDCIPFMVKKLVEHHPVETVRKVLVGVCAVLEPLYGSETIDRLLARMQVVLGFRKMSIGIYSPALHTMADEQEPICRMGSAVQDRCDLTYLVHDKVDLHELTRRYGLDLSQCQCKIIENTGPVESISTPRGITDRCHVLSEESANYDLFINTDMSQEIVPRSPIAIAVCHSSDHVRELPSSSDEYAFIYKGGSSDTHYGVESRLQEGTYHPRRCLRRARLAGWLEEIFDTIQREYSTIYLPEPEEVAKIAFNVRISADPRFA